MPRQLNIGVIGAGMIGDVHIENIKKDGRGQVTWISSRTRETLNKKLDKHEITNGSLDYRELLNDSSLDAVVIATPPHTHFDMLAGALKAEKHVLLEKPLTPNPQELQKAVELVKKHPNQVVLECSCRHSRLQPRFAMIKKMIDQGELGEVYHIHHNHLMRSTFIEYNPAGAWAHQKKLAGGGPLIDWGVYDLSFHLGILNDVPQLKSSKSFTRNGLKRFTDTNFFSDIEEHGAAFMEFDTGLTYYYERGSGVHADVDNETRIFASRGGLIFSFCSWDDPRIDFFTYDQKGKETTNQYTFEIGDHIDDGLALTSHFLDCLLEDATPQMTVPLAAKHLDILFRVLNG